jgi:hypothetical protein
MVCHRTILTWPSFANPAHFGAGKIGIKQVLVMELFKYHLSRPNGTLVSSGTPDTGMSWSSNSRRSSLQNGL